MISLKEIYSKNSTDSAVIGGDKGTIHSYIDHYYELAFSDVRPIAKRILEIGINSGHSLRMWKEYFYNSQEIIGVDINQPKEQILDCTVVIGDATDAETFKNIDNLDIIIDDGSHIFKHQKKTFDILYPKLNKGGIYVIEDIRDIDSCKEYFMNLPNSTIFDFRTIKNRNDDVIVEIKK